MKKDAANINVLIACEESQRVCIAFRERGFNAFSCDIQQCSGEHPEWHIWGDCIPYLKGNCNFYTENGDYHFIEKWDLIIAHPPCTYLTITGNAWFSVEKYGEKARKRKELRKEAYEFFMKFVTEPICKHIAIENPVGYMNTHFCKPDCIIQPYYFGDDAKKKTCLWLTGLPALVPTDIITPTTVKTGHGTDSPWHAYTWSLPPKERSKARSKTFPGIAKAMAKQWGDYLLEEGDE